MVTTTNREQLDKLSVSASSDTVTNKGNNDKCKLYGKVALSRRYSIETVLKHQGCSQGGGKVKDTARISTTGHAPHRQHASLAKRRTPMNILFDSSESETSDTECVEGTVDMMSKAKGTNAVGAPTQFVTRKKYKLPRNSTLQACSEISGGKRSVDLATKWAHTAQNNLQLAKQQLKDAENAVRDARRSVKLFKSQLSQTKTILKGEKLNLAKLEEKNSVINVDSECDSDAFNSGTESDRESDDGISMQIECP